MKHKKTIIYGGAFNPPTIAHGAILKACANYARTIDADVWILPSGNRTDKQVTVRRDRRLDFINAMIYDVKTADVVIDIITTELDRCKPVETCDTVSELMTAHPDRSFIWVFGSDSVMTMPGWGNGPWLLNNLEMLVVKRNGSAINMLAKNISILNISVPDVSSTEVRRRLETGESLDGFVTESIRQILDK